MAQPQAVAVEAPAAPAPELKLIPKQFGDLGIGADGKPRKPGPWCGAPGPGRPKGQIDKKNLEIRNAAREIVEDPEYRRMLKIRLQVGEAPHMETLLWHYAYGKPVDRVEVKEVVGDFEGATAEELRARALEIARRIQEPTPDSPEEAVH